jgi:hypothetical protein
MVNYWYGTIRQAVIPFAMRDLEGGIMKPATKWRFLVALFVLAIAYTVAGQALALVAFQNPPDLGSVSRNVYTNDSFGITYTFPQGWVVDKTALSHQTTSEENFHASQPQTDGSAPHGSYTLLMVSKLPEEIIHCKDCSSTRVHGPKIVLSVGLVSASDELQTASDIQNKFKQMFDGKGTRFVNGPTPCSFNGQTFSRMDSTNGVAYSGDAITIRNHYTIEFRLSADTPEQLEDLYATLNTLQLKP